MKKPTRYGSSLTLAWLLVLAGCQGASGDGNTSNAFKVGVMLPISGTTQLDFEKGLYWAVEEVNKQGVLGRKLEIDWEDIGTIPDDANVLKAHAAAARRFLEDPEISAVIGTDYDDTTFELAPAFIEAKKLLISPSATTAEITRAFGGKQYIWRSLESDVAQSELMVLYGHDTGVKRAALLSTSDLYGETFFDWIPFYAEEIGIEMTAVERMNEGSTDCYASVESILSGGVPDILYFISADYDLEYCLIESARALAPGVRIMFSDGGQVTGLFEALGDKAEGVEGVSLEAYRDPSHTEFDYESQFDLDFQERFGEIPPPYAANVFDSVALVAYALAQAKGESGEALAKALKHVVDSVGETASGEVTSWDGEGIRRALKLIEEGKTPDVTGATGELRFDPTLGTDLTATTYAVWQVKDVIQQWDEIQAGTHTLIYPANYFTKDDRRSKFDTVASERLMSSQGDTASGAEVAPRQGLWAYIAAFSRGWENYRHQADALNVYQRLRAQGVADDHIVLMLADDLANDPENPEPGIVRNVAGGPNLNQNVKIDYRLGDKSTKAQVLRILSGQTAADTPEVIQATQNDDVLVFWVGHGGDRGVLVGGSTAEAGTGTSGSFVTPMDLGVTVQLMAENNRYRRLLMILESCHGGAMGTYLSSPNAILMTGASPRENSVGVNYDLDRKIWRADAFPWAIETALTKATVTSVTDVYTEAFLAVRGSHAKMYNAPSFGPNTIDFRDFITP